MNKWWASLLVAFVASLGVLVIEHFLVLPMLSAEKVEIPLESSPVEGDEGSEVAIDSNNQYGDGQSSRDLRLKGDEAYRSDDFESAKYFYRRSLEIDPADNEARYWLARVYDEQEEYELAVKELEDLIESGGADWRAYKTIGRIYRIMEAYEDSVYNLRKAFEMHPDAEIQYSLAITYWHGDRMAEAIVCLEKTLEMDSEHSKARKWLPVAKERLEN